MSSSHRYSDNDRAAVYRVIAERRDMRHFLNDPVPAEVLQRVLQAAHQAPSVGMMQPWRFIRISSSTLRAQIHTLVEDERQLTAQALGERNAEFLRLKVEGIRDCAELWVAALMDRREAHIFGRRTLPEMDMASVACAIQNMWLAARAEGLGMGWVSLFDPVALAAIAGHSLWRKTRGDPVPGTGGRVLPGADAATGAVAHAAAVARDVV